MALDIRILIVDDDEDICAYMQTMLVAAGHGVHTLADPTLAVDEIRAKDYHVLIIDLMMPKMDGIACSLRYNTKR